MSDGPHHGIPVLVVGVGELADATAAALIASEAAVRQLRAPSDSDLRRAFDDDFSAVVLVSRQDIDVLRMALLVEHLRPGQRLIATIFSQTVARQLSAAIPDCRVVSMADSSVPTLTAACIAPSASIVYSAPDGNVNVAASPGAGHAVSSARFVAPSTITRLRRWLRSQLRPLDPGSRLLVTGGLGLLAVLVVDTIATAAVTGAGLIDSTYSAAKTVATVGPNELVDRGPDWFKALSVGAISMAALFFILFTAGLVNRLMEPRLSGIVGSRTVPRANHVVIVGLGQVGLRLALALRAASTPVVVVERDRAAPTIRIAKDRRVPVVIGEGTSRHMLEGLSLGRAVALAAVTSDDGTNVAISVAALAANPTARVVLRAGDGDVTTETQALFHIGTVVDVQRLAAAQLTAEALGHRVRTAFFREHDVALLGVDGQVLSSSQVRARPSDVAGARPERRGASTVATESNPGSAVSKTSPVEPRP